MSVPGSKSPDVSSVREGRRCGRLSCVGPTQVSGLFEALYIVNRELRPRYVGSLRAPLYNSLV
jgi:hypothetical protein